MGVEPIRRLRTTGLANLRITVLPALQHRYYTRVMWDYLLDIVFPKHCVSCGKWGKFICNECQSKIEFMGPQVCPYCERPSPYGFTHPRCHKPHGLDGMFVLAHYRGPISQAIREIKYRGTYGVIGEVVRLLGSKYHHQFNFDYLVPVPLHSKRELERGFNQAEKIASILARIMNQESRIKGAQKNIRGVSLLRRARETKPQFDLKYKERAANVRGAFALSSQYNLQPGTSFCLVDDVATTGATIFECAKVLKKAGAKNVWAITVARGG